MAWIYHNATLWLISLSSDWENWITIADKNLGATEVYNDWDTLTAENSWWFFQWWNNHMFAFTWPTSSEIMDSSYSVDARNYWPWNYYDAAYFVLWDVNKNWDYSRNTNLRWNDTNTNEARRWPCSEWFHIPSKDEIVALKNAWITLWIISASDGSWTKTYFKIPMSWFVYPANWTISNRWTYSWLRSSYRDYYNWTIYESSSSKSLWATSRASVWWWVIRPFKNEPEIPDYNDVWDTLYWDELPDRPVPVPVKKLKWLMNKWNFYYFNEAPTHASSVTLNESSIVLTEAWQTYQLTATVAPDDAVIKKVHWSSSDLTVATVTQTGLVTCVTPGECTITASCDWASATCDVVAIIEAYIEFLLVWWGWWGWNINKASWWWWAWWLLHCCDYLITSWQYCVVVWDWWWTWAWRSQTEWCNWCNSTFDWITAYWWWGWAGTQWYDYWQNWWSWWWWGWCAWWTWCVWQWHDWGKWAWYSSSSSGWWGWWWAWWAWCCWSRPYWWLWWTWCTLNISWVSYTYSRGWDGSACLGSCWTPRDWVNYWDWWWWACWCYWYCWHSWIFIARYPTACWYNISWWCKYTCWDYTIHCFTSDGTLTIS